MNEEAKRLIDLAIEEDLGAGDITTQAIYSGKELAEARILSKANGVIAGIGVAEYILQKMAPDCQILDAKKDGDPVQYGNMILHLSGQADQLLKSERLILNFMQRMSAVATATHMMVQSIAHTKAKLLDTRKTMPGHRYLDKWAVRLGGGQNHRMRLDDRYLIKENHITVAGGIRQALIAAHEHRKNAGRKDVLIEIEVPDKAGLISVLATNDEFGKIADIVMLDNMSVSQMRKCVELVNGRVKLEASGNVSQHTIIEIAQTGVDYISSGAITHSVQALDMSMIFSAK